jgi:hypothetical protein
MAVRLHRCKNLWVKLPGRRVQRALDEQGVAYEIVKEPWTGDRGNNVARTGQKKFPWIEFEDGTVYREESKDMAETIKSGWLESKRAAVSPPETAARLCRARGYSSAGRAPGSHPGGRRFESG